MVEIEVVEPTCCNIGRIAIRDYFPLSVRFAKESYGERTVAVERGDGDCLELHLDALTGRIAGMLLIVASDVVEIGRSLIEPECRNAEVRVRASLVSRVPLFRTELYDDGVVFVFSEVPASSYVRFGGRTVFGIGEANELVELLVCDMDERAIDHMKYELECNLR